MYTAYPGNDEPKHALKISLESCQTTCYNDKKCEVFTYTVDDQNPANGECRKKTSRGKEETKGVKKNKISGAGRMTCPGIEKLIKA